MPMAPSTSWAANPTAMKSSRSFAMPPPGPGRGYTGYSLGVQAAHLVRSAKPRRRAPDCPWMHPAPPVSRRVLQRLLALLDHHVVVVGLVRQLQPQILVGAERLDRLPVLL